MKKFSKVPIAYQLYLFAFFLIIIISTIFMLSYIFISKSIIKSNIDYTSTVFDQIQQNIEDKTGLLENLLNMAGYNRSVFQFIVENNNSRKYDELMELDNQSLNITKIENDIKEFVIEGFNGVCYYSNGKTENVYQALQKLPEEPINLYDLSVDLTYPKNGQRTFLLSTSLYDIWNITDHKFSGRATLVVDMRLLGIKDFKDNYDTGLFILDENYRICTSNQADVGKDMQKILGKILQLKKIEQKEMVIDDIAYIINFNYLNSINAYALSITPKANIMNSINWIGNVTYSLLLVALVLLIFMLMAFNYIIVAPLKKLGTFMKQINKEDEDSLESKVELYGYKEIVEISVQFNHMFQEIRLLTHNLIQTNEKLFEIKLQKKQAELLYLKAQINPHFLFNTLEVILGIAYDENAPKTAGMIKSLSKIFKYSVKGSDMVALADELKIVRSYIHIQQTRFVDAFEAHYEFDEEVLQQRIPKMLLQPLIENAINHGLVNTNRNGNIYVGGKMTEDRQLFLWVRDDGAGMDKEKRAYLQSIIDKTTVRKTDSIGFENVIYRLQLIYRDECKIMLESIPDEGTQIMIYIPIDQEII